MRHYLTSLADAAGLQQYLATLLKYGTIIIIIDTFKFIVIFQYQS